MYSHTTKTHAKWAKDPVNFRLPDNHTLMIEKAKLSGGNNGGGQPPPVAPPPVAPPPAAKANILSKAKITEYERTSADPKCGFYCQGNEGDDVKLMGRLDPGLVATLLFLISGLWNSFLIITLPNLSAHFLEYFSSCVCSVSCDVG